MRLARLMLDDGPGVIIRGGEDTLALVERQAFADLPDLLAACEGDVSRISAGTPVTVRDEKLLCPLDRPRKIVCIGLNYHLHAAEANQEVPKFPIIFPKWDNALTGPFSDIPLPPESNMVDWEAEFAFVFGKRCRRVSAGDAGSVIFGYTAANDVSMRDFQFQGSQWGPGKDWDLSTPLGPVVVSRDELGDQPDLAIRGRLNGETMQESRTSDLIFHVGPLVEYITTFMTMEPGDVVLTGTPSGVGSARRMFLKDGDVYEVEIEGIGTLRNRFVGER